MNLILELGLSYRFFKSKAKDKFISVISLFSIIGIALGVGTLIVVMSIMNGYENELISRLSGIDGDITIENSNESDKISQIASNYNPSYIINQISGQGMLIGNGGAASAVSVRGVNYDHLSQKPIIAQNLRYGSFDDYDQIGVLIGTDLALKLGANIGDQLRLVVPSGTQTLMGFIPKFKSFTLVGVFDTGMYEHNMATIFISQKFAGTLFAGTPIATEIKLQNDAETFNLVKQLQLALPAGALISNKFEGNMALREALKVERVVMYVILTLIIIVAVFNIISSLIILVKDKSKNIAILKTYGMSSGAISRIFVMAGSFIGVIGVLIGSAIGIVFVLNIENLRSWLEQISGVTLFDPVIYYLTNLPAYLDSFSVFVIILTALILTLLATLYPSFRAGRLDPIQILRNE